VESRRAQADQAGNITIVVAYCNIILNPLIYISRYDVVKSSLVNWLMSTADRLCSHRAPSASDVNY